MIRAAEVQTDPVYGLDFERAHSPRSLDAEDYGSRTPLAEDAGEEPAEETFSPIPIASEGLDESARAALESARRILGREDRGAHEDEADAIAERGAFQAPLP